jgi:lysozyme
MDYSLALKEAKNLCRKFEGLRLSPYLCPAGIPTIGYGSTYYTNGKKVSMKDTPINRTVAEQILEYNLMTVYLPGVLARCPGLTDYRLAAILDFAYNLGVTRFKGSTLAKYLEAKEWGKASEEIKKWNKAGGRILKGLVLRRELESQLLLKEIPHV